MNDIIQEFKEHIEKKNLTVASVARLLDISTTTLHLWLKGKYEGNSERIEKLVKQFLQIQKERDNAPKSINFKMTRAAKIVFDTIRLAHVMNEMTVIVSRAGYGKTMAIKQYVARNRDAVLIEARPSQQTYALVYELGKKLTVSIRNDSDMIFQRIVTKLQISPKVLIFDEAQLYNYRALEMIRRIHDVSGCGVVLAGSYRLYDQMLGKDLKDFDQLFSRVVRRELPPLNIADIKLLVQDKLGTISDQIAEQLLELCQGSARYLEKNIKLAESMVKDQAITMKDIEKAHNYLMIKAA